MIYTKILNLCKEKKINFSQLERYAGLGNGVIRSWEHGNPRIDLLIKVCKVLDCKVEDIITDEVYDDFPVLKAQ